MSTTSNTKKAVLVAKATPEGVLFCEHNVTRTHFTTNSCTPGKSYNQSNLPKYLTNNRHDLRKSEARKIELETQKRKQELTNKLRRQEIDRIVQVYPRAVKAVEAILFFNK